MKQNRHFLHLIAMNHHKSNYKLLSSFSGAQDCLRIVFKHFLKLYINETLFTNRSVVMTGESKWV